MLIGNTKKQCASKTKQEMEKFIAAFNLQKELKDFQDAMPSDQYWDVWYGYESKMKTSAKEIKKDNLIKQSSRLYPEYKDVLNIFMELL